MPSDFKSKSKAAYNGTFSSNKFRKNDQNLYL